MNVTSTPGSTQTHRTQKKAPAAPSLSRDLASLEPKDSLARSGFGLVFGATESVVCSAGNAVGSTFSFAGRVLKGFERPKVPAYKEDSGSFEVGIDRETFLDEKRQRKIPMTVYYPKGQEKAGSSPVVVMSHGLGGNSYTYQYFGKHLASHGYTVMQPTHVGSNTTAFLTKTPVFAFTQGELKDRVEDVKFALDLMESKKLSEEITDSADMKHVALAGHSFGALTAEAMAGMVANDDDGKKIPLGDKRIDAFIAMSPYGDSLPTHLLGLDVDSYDEIDQPILYISGEKDQLFTLGKGAKVHSKPYQETGTDEKYHLVIEGARHVNFAQVVGLFDHKTVEMTNSVSTAFLDRYLKNDKEAGNYLRDDLPAVARTRDSWAFVGNDGVERSKAQ